MTTQNPSFLEQLKQRHVFRVAAMYSVTAWLLVQIGSATFEPLGLPSWSQKALIIVVALGFPIALVLAWIFDVTPNGIVQGTAATTAGLSRGRKLDIVIIVVLLAALVTTFVWRREPSPRPVAAQDSSIAVLPFLAMSDDASLRHFGDGIAEEITNQLAGRPGLEVASRTSAFQAREGKDAVAIAKTLGVSYVVEGSVRPIGDQVRLTAQLIRADGFHVWSQTFDLPAASSPTQQDETIQTVSLMVDAYVDLERDLRDARSQTTNEEAYKHYAAAARLRLQVNTGGTTRPNSLRQIVDELDRAIALEPRFADAYGLRANAYMNQVGGEVRWPEAGPEARRSIDKALALEPDKPLFLSRLAGIQIQELDLTAAQQTLDRLRSIDPDDRNLNQWLAFLAMIRGNIDAAMRYWQQDLEKDPYNVLPHGWYSLLLDHVGDFAAADRERAMLARLTPQTPQIRIVSALVLRALDGNGDLTKAKALFAPMWAQHRHPTPQSFGFALAALGYEDEARELLANMLRDSSTDPYFVFLTYYGLKDYVAALAWLRRSIDDRNINALASVRWRVFPGLSDRPDYAELLQHLDSLLRSP